MGGCVGAKPIGLFLFRSCVEVSFIIILRPRWSCIINFNCFALKTIGPPGWVICYKIFTSKVYDDNKLTNGDACFGTLQNIRLLVDCNQFIYCIHCTKRWKSIEIPNSYSLIETSRELKISNSDAVVNLNYVFELIKVIGRLAVLVAQLVECLLLTPEVRGSQSRHRQVFCYLHVVNCIEKTK